MCLRIVAKVPKNKATCKTPLKPLAELCLLTFCGGITWLSLEAGVKAYSVQGGRDGRERRGGIGTAVYQECNKRAKEQGATSAELKVWNFNTGAIKFYQSLGMSVQSLTMEKAL